MKNWILSWVLDWLAEKTTWAGFVTLVSAFGLHLDANVQTAVIGLAVSFFAMPDRKKIPPQ
jgi:hypothetical protein